MRGHVEEEASHAQTLSPASPTGNPVTGPSGGWARLPAPPSSHLPHGTCLPAAHTLALNQCLHQEPLSLGLRSLFLQSPPGSPGDGGQEVGTGADV